MISLHCLMRYLLGSFQDNDNGLHLTQADSISFMGYLSTYAHNKNLSIGLKNAGAIVSAVLPAVQFSVNEQCVQYSECTTYSPFIDAGKPVFHIEYPSQAKSDSGSCKSEGGGSSDSGFSTVLKNMTLDGWVGFCNGTTATTPMNSTSS
jgi:hypothetical protein